MAPSSILFEKNDSCRDSIRDPRRRASSYRRSLQDMASLFGRLQARGARPHRPQQPSSLHGYEESELQTSLLGPGALPIPFSNWQPPGQSKCSCRWFVKISTEKLRWGGWASSCEWPNLSSFAEFTDQCQLSRAQSSILPPITPAPSSHLWDLRPTSAPPFLGWPTKRASLQRSLQGQHRRYEIETTGTAERGQTGAETQSRTTSQGLAGYQRCPALPGLNLRPGNHPDRTHQQASRWSTSRPLWHQKNTRTRCTEILLANAPPWHRRLREGMRYMPSLESSPTQAIRWLTILAGSYPSLEGLIDGFRHGFANFDGLEGRQLWLNPRHCRPAHEDGSLRASQGHHRCPGPSKGHYQRSSEASRPPRLNCHWLGVFFHLEVLIIAMLFLRHQAEIFHRLSAANERPNWEVE